MTAAAATLNIALGLLYLQIGSMVLWEMARGRRTLGFSHFGAAIVALAFTCGPHHFVHGVHLGFEGRAAAPLDLVAVLVGLPAAATWYALRLEAFRGGPGDRFLAGSPVGVLALPPVIGAYVTALVAAMIAGGPVSARDALLLVPNLLLVGLYATIAYFLIATQLANRRPLGGWSVSGLALTGIFVTCAAMHLVYAYYGSTGAYGPDSHGLLADWLAVPAAVYFLWVVRALNRGTFRDWNGVPTARAAGPAVRSTAPARDGSPREAQPADA